MNASDTFVVRARQLMTMPEAPESLAHYDPDRIEERDRELTGLIEDAGVWVVDGTVEWFGAWNERPRACHNAPEFETGLVTPGWIDCHTHSVFAGHRAGEFVLRNAGHSYAEILESGGGILNSCEALRNASQEELEVSLTQRVLEFVRVGVTTLEVKSGYGLSTEHELKSLRAIRSVDKDSPCELVSTFLGAHAIPAEHRSDRQRYVDCVCDEMIPAVASEKLADYVDVFCDRGAFTVEESRRVLEAGMKRGMVGRVHADELSNAGAARLAAELGCASADHLEFTDDEAIAAMADAGVTAVLMPAVNLFLGTVDHLARARDILTAGCEVAIATDFNPGSAMTSDLAMMTTLACTLYKMTPGEVLRAVTIGAAKALARKDRGRIRKGARANLTCLNVPDYAYVPYHFGTSHVEAVVQDGQFVYWIDVGPN